MRQSLKELKLVSNLFDEAVAEVISSKLVHYESESCPDQFVGRVQTLKDHSQDFPYREPAVFKAESVGQVILILESPHIREFFQPFGPAKGSTGRLIRKHLCEILVDRCVESWDVYLVNAIQNQCSLGKVPSKYRDAVFCRAWSLYGEQNFIDRLRALVNEQTIVINACTKVSSVKTKLLRREIVEEAVVKALERQSDIRITHPASWASQANRRAVW